MVKRASVERRAHVGITNLGHTCYIGCVLQAIQSFPELRDAIVVSTLRKASMLRAKEFSVSLAVAQCLMLMTQSQQVAGVGRGVTIVPVVDPSPIRRAAAHVDNKYLTDEEQDAAEFFSLIISSIHDDLDEVGKKKFRERRDDDAYLDPAELSRISWEDYNGNNSSPISQFLAGQSSLTLQCQVCMRTSTTFDVVNVLPVPVALTKESSDVLSVAHCLRASWACTKLSGDVKWMCPFCKKKVEAVMQSALVIAPTVLVVQLNRFEKKKDSQTGKITTHKVDVDVSFDETLRLHRFDGYSYELVAMILHTGSLSEGHYTCVTKYDDGLWYLHNDSTVTRIGQLPLQAKEPYMLLYRKLTESKGQAERVKTDLRTTVVPTEVTKAASDARQLDRGQLPPESSLVKGPEKKTSPPRPDDEDGQVIDVTPKDLRRVSANNSPLENSSILLQMYLRAMPETLPLSGGGPISIGSSGVFSLPWLSGSLRLLWGICKQGSLPPLSEREKIAFSGILCSSLCESAVVVLRTILRQNSDEMVIRRLMEAVIVPEVRRVDLLSTREREPTLCLQLWQLLHPVVMNWLLAFVPFVTIFAPSASGGVSRSVLWTTAPFVRRATGDVDEISAVQVRRAIESPSAGGMTDWVVVSRAWVENFVRSKFVGHNGLYAFKATPISTHRIVGLAQTQDHAIQFNFPVPAAVAIPEALFDVLWMMCGGGPKIRLTSDGRGERLSIQCVDCFPWVAELHPPHHSAFTPAPTLAGGRNEVRRLYQ